MPEAERLATLQLLDSNKAEVEARLAGLPIIIETPSAVSHHSSYHQGNRATPYCTCNIIYACVHRMYNMMLYLACVADSLAGHQMHACTWTLLPFIHLQQLLLYAIGRVLTPALCSC
jgi:hypothetical protein